jgi:drug/metabolite transporter (DMT)-like permease
MARYYFPIVILVVTNVLYHVSQKGMPEKANPAAALTIAYAFALLASLLLFVVFPPTDGWRETFLTPGWRAASLGIAAAGIEVGFLMAYRAGWPIGSTALFANVSLTLVLIPIGALWIGETITVWNALGIVLAIVGLRLMSLQGGAQ